MQEGRSLHDGRVRDNDGHRNHQQHHRRPLPLIFSIYIIFLTVGRSPYIYELNELSGRAEGSGAVGDVHCERGAWALYPEEVSSLTEERPAVRSVSL